ncbi:MAG: GNAT family N-acetyltransferase [Candidatus Dojkabacteria bacterium]
MEEILKADESKLEDIFSVISKCSAWMATEHGMNHWKNYYTREVVKEKLKYGDVYVEYLEGEAVATMTLSEEAPPYYTNNEDGPNGGTLDYTQKFPSSKLENTKALWVSALGVVPAHQGSGLASKLLKLAEIEAIKRGCNAIRFDSRISFTQVVNFYIHKGYQRVGTMMDGDDEYGLFEKVITG